MAGAWLVHLYTASSALLGLLALIAVHAGRYREAFAWLGLTIVIDSTDGMLARLAHVKSRLPDFDGAKLDDIVDYVTYVFVPAYFVWHAPLAPPGWPLAAAGAMLLSSAYGFNTDQAKTADHFYTGFPSYWNVVVFYLYVADAPPAVNAGVLLALSILVFVPIRYVYPSRTRTLRTVTMVSGSLWAALMFVILWLMPDVPPLLVWLSLLFPAYYFALSFALEYRRLVRGRAPE